LLELWEFILHKPKLSAREIWGGAGCIATGVGTSCTNTYIGEASGTNNNVLFNTFIGDRAGAANTNNNNTFIGYHSGISNTSGWSNAFMGSNSGASNTSGRQNCFVGFNAGNANNTHHNNTFMGFEAGIANDADENTFLGSAAGWSNVAGYANTFVGFNCGRNIIGNPNTVDGHFNTFVGHSAGALLTTGYQNTLVGYGSGFSTTGLGTGYNNTTTGYRALASLTSGHSNVAIGHQAAFSVGTGNYNTAVGLSALGSITSATDNVGVGRAAGLNNLGSNNVFLGAMADVLSTVSYAGAIGSNSIVNCNNCMSLGGNTITNRVDVGINNSTPTSSLHIIQKGTTLATSSLNISSGSCPTPSSLFVRDDGAVGIGINPCSWNLAYGPPNALFTGGLNPAGANGTVRLDVNGVIRAQGVTCYSDERLKKEIKPIEGALKSILKLQGKSYFWKNEEANGRIINNAPQIGFLAQDVAKIIPEAVAVFEDGSMGLNYNMFIPVLTEAIKELQNQVNTKDEKIAQLENKLNDFEKSLSECCMNYHNENENLKTAAGSVNELAKLEQNNPNPFTESSSIRFYIPSNASSAVIKIYSMSGTEMKSFSIEKKGAGQINVTGKTFAAGSYVYTLLVDGKQIDSKYMTLTK